jgi:tetratricopeptide (TPR) repeat protein
MGQVYLQKLDQPDQAEFRLTQALELNPGYVPALISLTELYKGRRDWLKAARNLESAVEYSTFKLEKTNLAAEAGFIYFEELDKKDKAVALFAKVLEIDPEHVKVGRVLGQIYYDDGNFAGADPIYDVLTRKTEQLGLSEPDQRDLFLRAAKVARKLGNADRPSSTTARPSTSTRPTATCSSAWPTCCSRRRTGRRRSSCTRRSWSSTARPRARRRRSSSTTASA